jgi:hypothetical protein
MMLAIIILFSACGTPPEESGTMPDGARQSGNATLTFSNKTAFTAHIVVGSGRINVCSLAPLAKETVKNVYGSNETFYPVFDIPLTERYSLPNIRAEDRNFYYRVDNSNHQEIIVSAPAVLGDKRAYIVFSNQSKTGGVEASRNPPSRLSCIDYPDGKTIVNAGETVVYSINPADKNDMRLTGSVNIAFESVTYRPSFVYSFAFDGAAVSLTDARPLLTAGEKSWSKIIESEEPLQLVRDDTETAAFLAVEKNQNIYYSFSSDGGPIKRSTDNDDGIITTALQIDNDALLIAGYHFNGTTYSPVFQKQNKDSTTLALLAPSNKADRASAYFLSVAKKDSASYITAGGADDGYGDTSLSYKAYIRAVRDNGSRFEQLWELGPAEFDAASGGIKCGALNSIAYNKTIKHYIATGGIIEYDNVGSPQKASYIALISETGEIKKIDGTFRNISFYKIIIDTGGAYYLTGEEEKAGETSAVAIKYDANDKELWRIKNPPHPASFYNDALFDEENGCLVLGGTMNARDGTGAGGTPFIEALSGETGARLWREELTQAPFKGASVVTGITKAHLYGFILSLSAVKDSYPARPFIAARVNTRGR